MKTVIQEYLGEIEYLSKKFDVSISELALCASVERTDRFNELNETEVKWAVDFLRDLESKKTIIWLILLYSFELELIDSLAYGYQSSNIATINEHLKCAGVIEKPLSELQLPEYEKALNHFRLLLKLADKSLTNTSHGVRINEIKSKKAFMKPITPEQLKCVNTLVSKLHISKDDKATMVHGFSGGRATSSKDLSSSEAIEMIKHLKAFDPSEKMRKKVFALAYEAGIIYGDTPDDKKMNSAKLNLFLLERGTVRKELNKMTSAELVKVVSQFEQIVKHSKQTSANKAAKSLLDELNLTVMKPRQKSR